MKPELIDAYMDIAERFAQVSKCNRLKVGAIIVKNGSILAHGWNGTVWKVIYNLRSTRDDLQVYTVNTDWGVGVIRRGKFNPIKLDNPFYEFNQMSRNRRRDLGIIEVHEFEHWINY